MTDPSPRPPPPPPPGLFDRHLPLRQAHAALQATGVDPFNIRFDAVLSPTEARIAGRRVIMLGSNNYLGLTFDAQAVEAGVASLRTRGTGTTGSRIANGSFEAHLALEQALARYYGRRHAMVFTTGYQANLGVLSSAVGRGDHLLLDRDSHASLYDGARLGQAQVVRFRHNDPEHLHRRLARLQDSPGAKLIVVEGLYSMIGDVAPLKEIAAIKREMGAYLLVDEAHSMGVLGARGRGLAEAAGVEADVDFVVGTFSKSLGAIGGFCVSDLDGFDVMRVICRPYMFTASLPPAVVASTVVALARMEAQPALRRRLMANAHRLYHGLKALGFSVGPTPGPIVAVATPDPASAIALWNHLLAQGVYLNLALPPATPNGQSLLRGSVTAIHTDAQIDHVLSAFDAAATALSLLQNAPASRPAVYSAESVFPMPVKRLSDRDTL